MPLSHDSWSDACDCHVTDQKHNHRNPSCLTVHQKQTGLANEITPNISKKASTLTSSVTPHVHIWPHWLQDSPTHAIIGYLIRFHVRQSDPMSTHQWFPLPHYPHSSYISHGHTCVSRGMSMTVCGNENPHSAFKGLLHPTEDRAVLNCA